MEEKHVERTVTEEAGKPQAKATPIQIAAITLSSVAIVGMGIMFLTKEKVEPKSPAVQQIGTEANIIANEEEAANVEPDEPFSFTTMYQRDIYITNGKEASCFIGNSEANYYEDMYIQIYLNGENGELGEEVYISQIIPRGSHIESFTANRELEPGDYEATLIFSSVNEKGELVRDLPFVVEIHVAE